MLRIQLRKVPIPVLTIWAILVIAFGFALYEQLWPLAFLTVLTGLLTAIPLLLASRAEITLPRSFTVAIVAFIFATIFLGEAFDFYERYEWWDLVLHGGSAIGFGMVGFLFVFTLFKGDAYAAPSWAMALIGFTVAVTIGAMWEIFEFAMDQAFGLNMQKSGLVDTMWDLIVDVVGGSLGAGAGFFYLRHLELGGYTGVIAEFVHLNRRLFRRHRR